MNEPTLYSQLGGEPAIEAATKLLVQKRHKDSMLSHYFVNMDEKYHQIFLKKYLIMFTGGPKIYDWRDLREAHKDLELQDEDFNQLMVLIEETLNDLGVSQDLTSRFCSGAQTLRKEILNK